MSSKRFEWGIYLYFIIDNNIKNKVYPGKERENNKEQYGIIYRLLMVAALTNTHTQSTKPNIGWDSFC